MTMLPVGNNPPKLPQNIKLPDITQEPVRFIDATPNDDYPLRILRAYRQNCNCKWLSTKPNTLIDFMNDCNDKRAIILDKAIAKLESGININESSAASCGENS